MSSGQRTSRASGAADFKETRASRRSEACDVLDNL
jgi:hypothetical protein